MSQDSIIPRGLCQCGCGQKTKLAAKTYKKLGWIKGQPLFYINGHNARSKLSDEVRFWSYVDRSGSPDACWPWIGYRDFDGYGQFNFDGKFVVHMLWLGF